MIEIQVRNGDLEGALVLLRREIVKDGIYATLKRREKYPNLTDRKKVKAGIAKQRRLKTELKKERLRESMAEFRRWGERKRPLRRREKQ